MKKTTLLLLLFSVTTNNFAQCWQTVTTGSTSSFGVKTDGTLWAWGANNSGQLGLGLGINNPVIKNTPTQIGSNTDWAVVETGVLHTLAIKTDGTLWAWGYNFSGQLGDGTRVDKSNPVQIGTGTDWQSVSAKTSRTFAIKTNGTLWAWGNNSGGEFGNGTGTNSSIPIQIGTANNWQKIITGFDHTLAIKTDGTLWAWGNNLSGQLGNGTSTSSLFPAQIGTANNWQKISCGDYHSMAIKTDGSLWGWGLAYPLGLGSASNVLSPMQFTTSTNWASVTAYGIITLATKTDGTLWGLGGNYTGQQGNGTATYSAAFTQTGIGKNWGKTSSGNTNSFGILIDGSLWATGNNLDGQLGNGTTQIGPNYQLTWIPINCPSTVLPIKLIFFTAVLKNQYVSLSWQTAQESNSKTFEIEYSINGNDFTKIGEVAAAGNTITTTHYNFEHTETFNGLNYYRLKAIDNDGKFTYSEIRLIRFDKDKDNDNYNDIRIYPNPFIEALQITSKHTNTSYHLYDVLGKKIKAGNLKTGSNFITSSGLSTGVYILSIIKNGTVVKTMKLVKK